MASNSHLYPLTANGYTRYGNEQTVFKEMYSEEYGDQILTRFNEFRADGMFCDFTLIVEDKEFKLHKLVLAGCSDYFRALFSHGMKDSNVSQFVLREVTLQGLKPLIDFAYTGKLMLNIIVLPEILEVATFLQMRPAITLCQLYLKTVMNLEDSDDIVNLGVSFGLTELREAQKQLILTNFLDFAETQKFLDLDSEKLISYLKEDSLNTTTEGKLLKCVLKWYKYDVENRGKNIDKVLAKIRYVQDGWSTIDYAAHQEPFASNLNCQMLIRFCHRYMHAANRKHLISDDRTRVRYCSKSIVQIGGVVNAHQEMAMEFPFIDEWMYGLQTEEKVGWGRNYYYHHKLKQWLPTGVIGTSEMRSHSSVVDVNGHAILVGGYLYTANLTHIFQHCSNEVKVINPGNFSMWDLSYMSEPRAHHVAVSTPSYVYAIGGKNESGALRTVECYHIQDDMWGSVRPLPSPRYDHAAAGVGEQVYISGGIEEDVITKSMLCFDPTSGNWEEKPSMLARRARHSMSVIDNQLIVCGGTTNVDSARCLTSVESYSLELEQWTYLTPMRKDCCGMGAVVLNNWLLLVGGEDSVGDLIGTVQKYDPKEKTWTKYCDLLAPLKNAGVCAMTIKLTETGEEDRDSLMEEYENRIHNQISDDEFNVSDSSDGENNGLNFIV